MKKSLSIVLVILVFSVIGFVGLRHSLANQTAVSVGMTPAFVPNEVLAVSANTTSYVMSDNVATGYYYFYVRAYRADGESTKTAIAAVKVD